MSTPSTPAGSGGIPPPLSLAPVTVGPDEDAPPAPPGFVARLARYTLPPPAPSIMGCYVRGNLGDTREQRRESRRSAVKSKIRTYHFARKPGAGNKDLREGVQKRRATAQRAAQRAARRVAELAAQNVAVWHTSLTDSDYQEQCAAARAAARTARSAGLAARRTTRRQMIYDFQEARALRRVEQDRVFLVPMAEQNRQYAAEAAAEAAQRAMIMALPSFRRDPVTGQLPPETVAYLGARDTQAAQATQADLAAQVGQN